MRKKIISVLMCSLLAIECIGCGGASSSSGSSSSSSSSIVSSDTASSSVQKNEDKNKDEDKVDILNPFNLKEETLSEQTVMLDGWNCKTQMDTLETCRLMLSTNHKKSEDCFSFVGYVYEKDTNIPDAIFIDNSVPVTNDTVYAVGLCSGKEGQEKFEANPNIAKYKYSRTGGNKALILRMDDNQPIGEVQEDYVKIINERIEQFKKDFVGLNGVETKQEETKKEEKKDIPTEYKSALTKAKLYADNMNMSKQSIYEQLTSEYGEKFSAEAAQYAIDNLQVDYKQNALKKAQSYQESMSMSPRAIYDQLVSEYGEKFTAEEAQYAIDNLK